MSVIDEQIIAKSVYNHLNEWPDKPCPVRMEIADKAPIAFSMAMQQLAGSRKLRQYIDGSFVGAWPFAVYVRVPATDTAKRFSAVRYLESLNLWLMTEQLPDLGDLRTPDKFEMTSIPAVAAQWEDGSVDYQAIFQLTYKQRSDFNV